MNAFLAFATSSIDRLSALHSACEILGMVFLGLLVVCEVAALFVKSRPRLHSVLEITGIAFLGLLVVAEAFAYKYSRDLSPETQRHEEELARQAKVEIQKRDDRIAELEHRTDPIDYAAIYVTFDVPPEIFERSRNPAANVLPLITEVTLITKNGKRFAFSPGSGVGFYEESGRTHLTYDYRAPRELLSQRIGILNTVETLQWTYKAPRGLNRSIYNNGEVSFSANDRIFFKLPTSNPLSRPDGLVTFEVSNQFRSIEDDYVRAIHEARKPE